MALERILNVSNVFDYADCSGPFTAFDIYGTFCTLGSNYSEKVALVDAWVYDAAIDRYRLVVFMDQKVYPSWSIQTWVIHPETGAVESHESTNFAAVSHAWTGEIFNGGLNKLFATYIVTGLSPNLGQGIVEITDKTNLIPTTWQIEHPIINSVQVPDLAFSVAAHAICPERKLAVLFMVSLGFFVYDYSNYPAASTLVGWHPFPEGFCWSAGYEDDQRTWALFSNDIWNPSENAKTTLIKYNFLYNRVELVTELQKTSPADRIAKVAWDSKRKKLGVIRIKQEAADGAAINAFEVYNPQPAMTQITVPVNVSRLVPGKTSVMISNLLGTKAESGGGFRRIDLTATPSYILEQAQTLTKNNGSASFEVTPQSSQEIDTVTVSYDETKVV